MERRTQVLIEPLDAWAIDVTTPKLAVSGLGGKVAKHTASTATEIEYTLTGPGPVVRQHRLDHRPLPAPSSVIEIDWVIVDQVPNPFQEAKGRKRQRLAYRGIHALALPHNRRTDETMIHRSGAVRSPMNASHGTERRPHYRIRTTRVAR